MLCLLEHIFVGFFCCCLPLLTQGGSNFLFTALPYNPSATSVPSGAGKKYFWLYVTGILLFQGEKTESVV